MAKKPEIPKDEDEETPADDVPAIITSKSPTAIIAGTQYKMKRRVVTPLLKHGVNSSVYIQFVSKIAVGKALKPAPGAAPMPPANIALVIDLTTGEEMQYIISAVLGSTLAEEYSNHSYVGKSFAILKLPPDQARGKRYATFSIAEIEKVA